MNSTSSDPLEDMDVDTEESTISLVASGTVGNEGLIADYLEFDVGNYTELASNPELVDVLLNEARKKGHGSGKKSKDEDDDIDNPSPHSSNVKDDKSAAKANRNRFGKRPAGSGSPGSGKPDDDDPFKDVTMDSVGGLEDQKQWLRQCILKHLKNKNGSSSFGIKPPKGVLFYGPPGTGKTLLARAFGNEVSKEMGKPLKFFHRKGGDVFSMWFGESSKNLRDLFQQAITEKPSIIFFDELDGLCPSRDGPGSHEAHNTVTTTLLGLMDTLPVGEVFVFGATNRVDSVDPAIRRPGRFDKHLEFLPPNVEARERILTINTSKWKKSSLPSAMQLRYLSEATLGYTGADIEKLCREAFFAAFDRHVPDDNLDKGIDTMIIGTADWEVALKKTKPSNTAVFGSTTYTPKIFPKAVAPLVVNMHREILQELLPLLPRASTKSLDLGDSGSASGTVSTFLLWDNSSLSVDVIESMILTGVLVNPKVADLPVYMLSQENILRANPATRLTYITETVNQAANSFKPCILYLPRLDDIISEKAILPFIARQFLNLRGKPVLLLATSSVPNSELTHEHNIRTIFSGNKACFPVRKPNAVERRDFFHPLFTTLGKPESSDPIFVQRGTLNKLAQTISIAVKKTEGDDIELIISLYDAFQKTFAKHADAKDKQWLLQDLDRVVKDYGRSKFRF